MSKKLLTCVTLSVIVVVFLVVSGCLGSRPVEFPDTDIVYRIGTLDNPEIGFVNADGSNNVVLAVDTYLSKPAWSTDGKTLYVFQWSGSGGLSGRISVWREGKAIRVCRNRYWQAMNAISLIPDSNQVMVNNATEQLMLIDLDRCKEIERYVDYAGDQSKQVRGVSLSSDGKRLLYGEDFDRQSNSKYVVKIMDIDTRETTEIIRGGINPMWSPDDRWIAYLRFDGIYIMAPDGSQNRRVVEYNARQSSEGSSFMTGEPFPRWSPGGKWLVYHKCIGIDCSIYKVEVATGVETKIVDGGTYPFWRGR